MSEKKSILARLLANENIEVRHGSYETAFFDVCLLYTSPSPRD